MKDTDEEIDTAEIEEEERIEYMKRSTATAVERMKADKKTMLDWNAQKNVMAFGSEKCIATRWTIGQTK